MTAMTCQELVELVTAYFDEALSPTDRARFEEHLADCGYCTLYVDQMRVTVQVAGQLAPPEVSATLKQDVLDIFRKWKQTR